MLFTQLRNCENQEITVLIIFYKNDCGVMHNRQENFGCGTCPKHLPHDIESQVSRALEYKHW